MSTSERGPAGRLAGVLVACVAAGVLWRSTTGPSLTITQAVVFGTVARIDAPAGAQPAVDAALAHWQQRERDWHAWQPSALTAFNAQLARDPHATIPAALVPLFDAAVPAMRASDGAFNPAIGELVDAWGFHSSDYPVTTPPPSQDWRAAWRAQPPCWSRQGDVIHVCGRAPRFDFNAIAEGVALGEARQALRDRGVTAALLSLGGDVLAIGQRGDRAWQVGLQDGRGGVLGGVDLGDGEAFLSSGSYVKYRASADGRRWPHVLDPRTGEPAQGARLSAVLHPDPARGDAASTALLAGGPTRFATLVRRMGLGCALLVDDAGHVWLTRGMAARFRWQQTLPEAARVDTGEACRAPAAE